MGVFRPCRACERSIAVDLDFCPHCRVSTDPSVPFDPPEPPGDAVERDDWGGLLSYLDKPSDSTRREPDWQAMEEGLAKDREDWLARPPPVTDRPPVRVGEFKDLRSYAGATRIMLASWVLICGVVIANNLNELGLLNRLERNVGLLSFEQIEASELRYKQVLVLVILGLVVSGILFGAWLYRSYRNLDHFGYRRRFKAFWAWGGLFVPIMMLFRPRQIIGEIWDVTRGDGRGDDSALLNWWWGLWIVSNIAVSVQVGDVDISDIRGGLHTGTARMFLMGIAALLAFIVVGKASARLDEMAGFELKTPRVAPRFVHGGLVIAGILVCVATFEIFESPEAALEANTVDGVYSSFGVSFPVPDDALVVEKGTTSEEPGDAFGMVVAQTRDIATIQVVEWFSFGVYSERDLIDVTDAWIASLQGRVDTRPRVVDPIGERVTVVQSATLTDATGRAAGAMGATSCGSGRTVLVIVIRANKTAEVAELAVESVLEDLTC